MGLSPLQSRLAASLAATFFVLLLYLFLFGPQFAAAESVGVDVAEAVWLNDGAEEPEGVEGMEMSYQPDFGLFDRGIVGDTPSGVLQTLENNKVQLLNLNPNETACYMVDTKALFPNDTTADNDDPPPQIYLSANTCQHPEFLNSNGSAVEAPQLTMIVTTSSTNACPKSTRDLSDANVIKFEEGAATHSLGGDKNAFVTILAPPSPDGTTFTLVYAFEVAASRDNFYHSYEPNNPNLSWMDSDSRSALLITSNLTHDKSLIQPVLDAGPPFELFVQNNNYSLIDGVQRSTCGMQTYAQISANRNNTGKLSTVVKTELTTKGPGGLPKQQFFFDLLNSSSSYTAVLVRVPDSSNLSARPEADGTVDGVVQGGGIVFPPTQFQTLPPTNCRLVTDLEFCDEIQYAVPGNDKDFNITQLAQAYDDYARQMYSNFEKIMMQQACDVGDTSRYSLVRTCDDCRAAYKRWLCTVSMPRCEDVRVGNPYAQLRNLNQSYPNGTQLTAGVDLDFSLNVGNARSRNSFIDTVIKPGPYREVLPCDDLCYAVVQSCPAAAGFSCPRPGSLGFDNSYGKRVKSPVTGGWATCNFPGEARIPISTGLALAPRAWMLPFVVGVLYVVTA